MAMLSHLSASATPLGWRVTVRGAVVSSLQQQAGSVAQDDHTSATTPACAIHVARRAVMHMHMHTSEAAAAYVRHVPCTRQGREGGLDACACCMCMCLCMCMCMCMWLQAGGTRHAVGVRDALGAHVAAHAHLLALD